MTYKITIDEVKEDPEKPKYPDRVEIYSQVVQDLDLKAVIIAVNKLNYDT